MKRLTKSRTDSMIAGVCGGIAEYFDIDPTLVRAGYLIFTFLGAGSPVILYILLAIIIPEAE
ncbi:PspC domain-containing protein [Carnobacteriaceae bacterium 52-44]|jgi:Putative stress-responsive transcriptional regulator